MDAKRKKWYAYQKLGKGYFHLCSDGWKEGCLFYKLFKTPKEYNTRLVKDYESFAGIASSLGEVGQADPTEVKDMTRMLLQNYFGGLDVRQALASKDFGTRTRQPEMH